MVLPLQPIASLQPMPLRQPMALLEDMPVEPTVALPVRPMALPLGPMAVIWPTPLAPVRRPMTFSGPPLQTSHGNGMALPALIDAAACALPTSTPCADMGTKRRAHPPKNERRSPLLKPRPDAGLFLCGTLGRLAQNEPEALGRGFVSKPLARPACCFEPDLGERWPSRLVATAAEDRNR
jgi:hypothetical protein